MLCDMPKHEMQTSDLCRTPGQPETVADDSIVNVVGERATAWDQFFLEWGRESAKASVPAMNDVLSKLLTLNSALIGGGFLAIKGDVLPYWWTIGAVACMIASLVSSLFGLMPVSRAVRLNDPNAIRDAESDAADRKQNCLTAGFVFLTTGFLLALSGAIVKGV